MELGSTQILELLAAEDGRYLLFGKGAPYNMKLKGHVISLRGANGREVVVTDGSRNFTAYIPRVMFDDFMRAHLITQNGQEDADHRLVFRLTSEGLTRGKAA